MKFCIQIEDKGKFIKIPFTKEEVDTLYGLCFFPENDEIKDNHFKIPLKKMMFVVDDVMNKGVVYQMSENEKFKKCKNPHYSVKKPKWKNKEK